AHERAFTVNIGPFRYYIPRVADQHGAVRQYRWASLRHWKAMLRISKITDYGTLLMSQMALQPERVHSASELALLLGLGLPTVSKILKGLSRHGLLVAVRGLHGGYSLARAPEDI